MATADVTLTESMTNPALFGSTFAAPSFWTWRTVAKLIDGIPLTEHREIGCSSNAPSGSTAHARQPVRRLSCWPAGVPARIGSSGRCYLARCAVCRLAQASVRRRRRGLHFAWR